MSHCAIASLRSLPNFMTVSPEDSLKLGNFPSIPLLTGVMSDETGGAVFGRYRNEVQNKLNIAPDYLTNDFIPYLQGTIPNTRNGMRFIPQAFSGYFNIFGSDSRMRNTIGRVAEALSDSLYNAPAFLTVDHWSKKANAFLYTFDHKGKRNYGKDFLAGLPIVDAKQSSKGIIYDNHDKINLSNYSFIHNIEIIIYLVGNLNHGDDLGFIFNRNTITGEKISDNDEVDEADENVTEIFTDMIANFARSGVPTTNIRSNGSAWMPDIIPNFSDKTNSFISITTDPKSMNNFR